MNLLTSEKNTTEVLKRGALELKKWITNNNNVNQSIPSTHRSNYDIKTIELEPQTSSILGLHWNAIGDSLEVGRRREREFPKMLTKKVVLSLVSSVFDPLGLFAPFTMRKRMLLNQFGAKMGNNGTKK